MGKIPICTELANIFAVVVPLTLQHNNWLQTPTISGIRGHLEVIQCLGWGSAIEY